MRFPKFSLLVFTGCILAGSAWGANFSFTGALSQDDNVQSFLFSVGAPSNVTLRTWSYAGGTNAAGTLIARGGFDTILALFDSTGLLLQQNDDGFGVAADSVTGAGFDTFLTRSLAIGTYTVTVMQFDNFAVGPNISNGFTRSGANFTAAFGCTNGQFCDVTGVAAGNNRTANWAFDILNVQGANEVPRIPEPGSVALVLSGISAVLIARRRK